MNPFVAETTTDCMVLKVLASSQLQISQLKVKALTCLKKKKKKEEINVIAKNINIYTYQFEKRKEIRKKDRNLSIKLFLGFIANADIFTSISK